MNKQLFFPPSRKPSFCSGCHGLAKCHCSSRHDVTSTFSRLKPPGAAQAKEIVVLTREFSHMPQSHLRSLDEQSTISSSHEGCCGKIFCCVHKSYINLGRVDGLCNWSTLTLSRNNTSTTLCCWLLNGPARPLVIF